jgi:hypothetical protein
VLTSVEVVFIAGAYACQAGPGVLTTVGDALTRPVHGLHFAGSHTAAHWPSYLEGGDSIAREAAQRLRVMSRAGLGVGWLLLTAVARCLLCNAALESAERVAGEVLTSLGKS